MPDRKFEQRDDRQKITLDFKQRIIDLMANQQPLPDVGIYDEPLRYFKANEQWCAVIFGWLDWLEDVAGWPESENENHAGIQAILIFEEGIKMEPIDYDLLKQAISEGMYEFGNNIAKQIVSGRTTNISVGEDGTVSNPSDVPSEDELPVDDPETPLDETMMTKSGGMSGVRLGINQIWSLMNSQYTAGMATSGAITRIGQIYILDDAGLTALVEGYWAARAAAEPYVASFAATLDGYFFCKGLTKQVLAEWIYEVHTVNQQNIAALMIDALTDEQMAIWYNKGLESPSTDYLAYSCIPIPSYEFTLATLGTLFSDTHVLKKNHRYLVTAEGYFVDTEGDIQDILWYKSFGAANAEVFNTTQLNLQISGAVKRHPTVFEVPYDPVNHRYQWSLEMGTSDASANWTLNRVTAVIGTTNSSPTGGVHITIDDLGEIVN